MRTDINLSTIVGFSMHYEFVGVIKSILIVYMEEGCKYATHIPHKAASNTISVRRHYQFNQVLRVLITT